MYGHGAIFTVLTCVYFLRLTKASMRVETYQLSFCVLFRFICAFHLETSSFFDKSFPIYSDFCVVHTSVLLFFLFIKIGLFLSKVKKMTDGETKIDIQHGTLRKAGTK